MSVFYFFKGECECVWCCLLFEVLSYIIFCILVEREKPRKGQHVQCRCNALF